MFARIWQAGLLATLLATGTVAQAQSLIRDAEIEQTLRLIADPVLRAAGLGTSRVNLYIVNNRELNAFVAGGDNIFLHSGLLAKLDGVAEIQAVIAHEAAHITGGHLARRNLKLRSTNTAAGIGALLAVLAAVGGSGEAAVAIGSGSQEALRRNLLAHSRAEEASADQAGLNYMVGASADVQAMLRVLKLFRGQELLSNNRMDPYVRTHPLWSDRFRLLEDRIASAPKGKPPSDTLKYWHARMVAKFDAFQLPPARILKNTKGNGEIATLSRAIAYHRLPNTKKSEAAVNALVKARPKDPFYWDLKGQFAIENGKAADAIRAYRQAVSLAPKSPLLLAGLGRALVAEGSNAAVREALSVLETSNRLDRANAQVLRDLGRAYAMTGQKGRASLATAERFALQTRFKDAEIHAKRAAGVLPEGTPAWRRAQDILKMAARMK